MNEAYELKQATKHHLGTVSAKRSCIFLSVVDERYGGKFREFRYRTS
ncbi:MAG: hypothetical protein ACI9UN_003827 [Granulosicoccus sp.]|jgi:hypothetical protein